jgi:hypothetical protein
MLVGVWSYNAAYDEDDDKGGLQVVRECVCL